MKVDLQRQLDKAIERGDSVLIEMLKTKIKNAIRVNSRELYPSLKTGLRYNEWVKLFVKNPNFIKNIDWRVKPVIGNYQHSKHRIEYVLTYKVVEFLKEQTI